MPDSRIQPYGHIRAGYGAASGLSDLSQLMEDRGIFPDHEVLSGRPSGLCT